MSAETINSSVGMYNNGATNCYNQPVDVGKIVKLLNLIPASEGGTAADKLSASPSPIQLYRAILRFQQTQNDLGRGPLLSVDGHVDPGAAAIGRLNERADAAAPAPSTPTLSVSQLVSPRGTPLNPKRIPNKKMINIFGERETEPGFVNYTSDPQWARGGDGVVRPWTHDPQVPPGLADKSASDICIRSSPLSRITLDEIARIGMQGCRVTIALNSGPGDDVPGGTNAQLQKFRDKFPGRKTLFDGVLQGTGDAGSTITWKVIVAELP
jgi:hypothetical protein